ncbi:MAG: hypothetical protein AAFP92_01310 [Bacteroidota bacterium]
MSWNYLKFAGLWLVLISFSFPLQAQTELDAFRHAQYGSFGTARALGMGGAYSAVGADISSATLNPAGLGVYRSSSLVFSPSLTLVNTTTSFLDGEERANSTDFRMPSWGMVFHNPQYYDDGRTLQEVERGLKSFVFSFGHNQLENYRRNIAVEGYNTESSISDAFAWRANQAAAPWFQLDGNSRAGLAFNTFVIDTLLGFDNQYFPAVNGGDIQQRIELEESGRRNEWFISLAGNWSDFIYIGGTVGIQSVNYEQTFRFREDDINNVHQGLQPNPAFALESPMNQIRFEDNFSTTGTGINGKFGVIIRPFDQLRLGASVQSPTFFTLVDQFSSNLAQNYSITLANGSEGTEESVSETTPGQYRYSLRTPYKVTIGGMYLLGKTGFLTADVDFTDYSSSRLSASDYGFDVENDNVRAQFQQVVSVRVGGEFRSGIFRLRLGAAVFGDPLTEEGRRYLSAEDFTTVNEISGERTILSAGIGIRQPNYFLDVSFINQRQTDKFNPYTAGTTDIFLPTAVINTQKNALTATVGFNF